MVEGQIKIDSDKKIWLNSIIKEKNLKAKYA